MSAYSNTLNNYITENGSVIDNETLNKMLLSKDKVQDRIERSYAYDDGNTVIPGTPIDNNLDKQVETLNEESGMNTLITQAAIAKAKSESDIREKTKQKHEQRKQFIESMMYQQGELYYQQHHYMMDGKTKRRVRKAIERAYDKGKYNKSGIYFEQPQVKQIVRNPKNTNTEPVNMQDILKM